MKICRIYLPVFLVLLFALAPILLISQTTETDRQISVSLSAGNASELSNYFNNRVDLTIPGSEDSYGKIQATKILQDFFSRYPVKSYKSTKQGSSNDGSLFTIGRMESGNKVFRVYYLLKKTSDKYLIHQFQIQEEN